MTITVAAVIDSSGAQAGAALFNRALASMRAGVAATGGAISGVTAAIFSLRGAIVAAAAGMGGLKAVKAADDFAVLAARLALVVPEGTRVGAVMASLDAAAERSRKPLAELADVYIRNAESLKTMGRSQADNVRLTETLAKVMQIGASSTQASSAAMFQLSQALASGKFQGDEFRSVAENAPEVMRILQRETGKTAGELRKLASEGKLTANVLVNAMLNASKDIDQKFNSIPKTAAQAFAQLTGDISTMTGEAARASGVSKEWAGAIEKLRDLFSSSQGGLRIFTDGIAEAGRWTAYFIDALNDARRTFAAFVEALTGLTVFQAAKALFDGGAQAVRGLGEMVGYAGEKLGLMARSAFPEATAAADSFLAKIRATNEELKVADQLRGGIFGEDKLKEQATDKKLPIEFGKGDDKAEQKKRERIVKSLEREIELTRIRNELEVAQQNNDTERVKQLEVVLALRQGITEDMKKASPALVAQLESEILITKELERRAKQQEKDNKNLQDAADLAGKFAANLVVGGKSAKDMLIDLGKQIAAMIAQMIVATIVAYALRTALGLPAGGPSFGGNPLGMMLGGLKLANGGVLEGGFNAANGRVLFGPTPFDSGGMRGFAGEAGPEAVLPLRRGRDGKLGVSMDGPAGGGSQSIVINVGGDATERTVQMLRDVAKQEFGAMAPGLVETSVSEVRRRHIADPKFMRR